MFENPSLITRITIGKALGLTVGLIAFIILPSFMQSENLLFMWGILIWYVTVGAVIGVFGIYTSHPILRLPMPWWIRGPAIGGWMNFVLTFFSYAQLEAIFNNIFSAESLFSNPFWFSLEGAIVGFLIDFFCTRFGGEGNLTP